jgi:hypothetical protein
MAYGKKYKSLAEKVGLPTQTCHDLVHWMLPHISGVESAVVRSLTLKKRCEIALEEKDTRNKENHCTVRWDGTQIGNITKYMKYF